MSKTIKYEQLTPTLSLSECTDGFWLYDTTRGMNVSMRAINRDAAFIKALTYYQVRLTQTESELKILKAKVNTFLDQFYNEEEI